MGHQAESLSRHVLLLILVIPLFGLATRGAEATLDVIAEQQATHQRELRQIVVHWRSTSEALQPLSGTPNDIDCRAAVKGEKRFYDALYTPAAAEAAAEDERRQAMSYDGSETHILMLSGTVRIYPGDERRQFGAPDQFLALQGYPKSEYRMWVDDTPFSCDLGERLQTGEYKLVGSEDVDGAACVHAAAAAEHLWFDPDRGYALRKRETLDSAANVRLRHLFDDLQEVQPGLWLAQQITIEYYERAKLVTRHRLEVVELDVNNVPDELFSLRLEPGTPVADMRQMPANEDGMIPVVQYKVPANPEDLPRVIAAAVERNRQYELSAREGSRSRWVLLFVNVLLLLLIVTGTLVFRWRLRRTRQS